MKNCDPIALDVTPYIDDPNIPNKDGQVPLLEALDCITLTTGWAVINITGDHIFRELLNHNNIDRQTTPPPLIPLMADCLWTLVPEVLKFNDTVVNFEGTEYEDYMHDYIKSCNDYNPILQRQGLGANKGFRDIYIGLFSAGVSVNDVDSNGNSFFMNLYNSDGMKADWFIDRYRSRNEVNWKYRNPNNNSTALHANIKCKSS